MNRSLLVPVYGALAVLGLAWTGYHNWTFLATTEGASLWRFIETSTPTPAAASIGADITVAFAAFVVWMFSEARRLGMKHAWAYLALSLVTAFAVGFPLFLLMRERRLAERGGA